MWSEVDETRQVDRGHTLKRTRRCANGHRFVTFEVFGPIYRRSPQTVRKTVVAAEVRAVLYRRNVAIARALQTAPAPVVAREFGLQRKAVNAIHRRFKP